ncbi:MAG: LPS export ABC transporter periplasmic protein LptC [Fimbriimonas sp.]
MEEKRQTINLGESKADRYGGKENRTHLWTVRWKSGSVDLYDKGGQVTGTMSGISGEIYKAEKVVSTFVSDESTVDKNNEVLVLDGHAKVISKEMKTTMTCDKIRYDAGKQLIRALGNVRIAGPSGTVSGLQEIWTTPDLKVVATPDMFDRGAGK